MTNRWSVHGLRIAVTGATGFVGRALVRSLAAAGARAIAIAGDVRSPLAVENGADVVCHLAARTGDRFATEPAAGFHVNVAGTLNALELARQHGARFVMASTCAVYRP